LRTFNVAFNYVYEYPTRYIDNILVLLQDLYMFRLPAIPIIGSTILQLTVTGITYITLDGEMYVTSTLKIAKDQAVGHITLLGN
jgi:hypothetical protein